MRAISFCTTDHPSRVAYRARSFVAHASNSWRFENNDETARDLRLNLNSDERMRKVFFLVLDMSENDIYRLFSVFEIVERTAFLFSLWSE